MLELMAEIWPSVVSAFALFASLATSVHAILYKRDTRSAVGWVGVIWLAPIIGAILYVIFGINRIKRRARALRGDTATGRFTEDIYVVPLDEITHAMQGNEQMVSLARLVESIVQRQLLHGNSIKPLVNGDNAFPEMIKSLENARHSITLSTYIFDNDRAGSMFQSALAGAVSRGVDVKVIIDDMGARYSFPSITHKLRKSGVSVARFLPTLLPWRTPFVNLRNHRKILVVDGHTAFTGGMNIREGLLLDLKPRHPLKDIHFAVKGPVVAHMQEAFAEDWAFCTGEIIRGERWFPGIIPEGSVWARGIVDGPDKDFEKHHWTVLGAISCAKSSIRVLTPYFLPDTTIIKALNIASMRGVRVDIILPTINNLVMVKWASIYLLSQVLEHGCRVWFTPPPFDHSKLMLVDEIWSFFGSSNWDPRSFQLNFEFNLECYSRELASLLDGLVNTKLEGSHEVTIDELDARWLPSKLRDGMARLFSPYM